MSLRLSRYGLLMVLAFPACLRAQVQHSRMPSPDQMRSEYMAETLKQVSGTIGDLRAAIQADDSMKVTETFLRSGLYSPSDGQSYYGTNAIRHAFAERLPHLGALLLTRVDFDASGNIAYQFGRYFYSPGPDGSSGETGTYVLVLYQDGKFWKVRSYVERANGGTPGS
jgi:ketosteroid isomerase-like protein